MSDETQEQSLPLSVVFIISLLVMGFLCWGFWAASYAANVDGREFGGRITSPGRMISRGLAVFAWVAFSYLPQLPAVMHYVITKQFWLVIVTFVLEGLVVAGFFIAITVDRKLNAPVKRKKGRKIATPKGMD